MRIATGVQFAFEKALIYNGFPIYLDINKLHSDLKTVTVEPLLFDPSCTI